MKYKYEKGKLFGKKLPVPRDVLNRVYNKTLSFSDYVEYNLFDKIPLECMNKRDFSIVQKIGVEKAKSLDWEVISKLDTIHYLDRTVVPYEPMWFQEIDKGIDPNEALYDIAYSQLKPKDYTKKMMELHPERVFTRDEMERTNFNFDYVMNNFNTNNLSFEDIIYYWSILQEKDLTYVLSHDFKNEKHITDSQFKSVMEEYGKIVKLARNSRLIDPYTFMDVVLNGSEESKEEYLNRVCTDILKHAHSESTDINLTNDEYKELFKHVDIIKFFEENRPYDVYDLTEVLKKCSLEEMLEMDIPFSVLIDDDVLWASRAYGIKVLMQFDKECDHFLTNNNYRFLKLIGPMYLHYAGNNHDNSTSLVPAKYDEEGNYISTDYTIDDFYEIVKRMLLYGPTDWNYSKMAPDFRSIGGKFREKFPGFFLSEDAPKELQDAFYTKKLTPEMLYEHPDYIPFLIDKELVVGFRNIMIKVYEEIKVEDNYWYDDDDLELRSLRRPRTEKRYRIATKDRYAQLYDYLLKDNSYEEVLGFVSKYAYFFEYIYKNSYYDFRVKEDGTLDDFVDALVDAVKYNVLHKEKYPKFVPDDVIDKHLDLFLPKEAPEELKHALYDRTINTALIKKYMDKSNEYFSKIDLNLLFPVINVYREKDLSSFPTSVSLVDYLCEKLDRKDVLEIMVTYGEYLEKINDGQLSITFKAEYDKEGIIDSIEKEIYKEIVNGSIAYSPEIGEHFINKYPTLFLDSSVPEEIRNKFYSRNMTIEDYNNPEIIKYFKNTDISFGLPLEYSWMHKLFADDSTETANLNKIKLYAYCQTIDDYSLRKVFIEYLVKSENVNMETIEYGAEVLRRLSVSNSSEMQAFKISLANQILDSKDPMLVLDQIEDLFIKNHIPVVGKVYSCFRILHPNSQGFNYETSMISPILKRSSNIARELIIFSDLIKASFGSNNRSVNDYLEIISTCNEIYKGIRSGSVKYEDLSKEDQEKMYRFSRCISTLYNNSLLSRRKNDTFIHTDSVIDDINKLYELVSPNGKLDYDLGDRVISMFCHFAGIDTLEQAKKYIKDKITSAEERNIEAAKEKLVLHKGDFIKGINDFRFLGSILQNGSVAKEFLGSHASSDNTPLDTDLSRISIDGTISEQINSTEAANYGPIWIVLRGDDRFHITRTDKEEQTQANRNLSKIELFYTGFLGPNHYGIRTGFASSEIDYLLVSEYNPKIGIEIAMNGFYIPVANKNGDIVFTYEDYLAIRKNMAGMSHFGEEKYTFSEHLITPETEEFASLIEDSNIETLRKRKAINEALASALEEIGLKLKTTIDGDLTEGSVELFDTGSTGRGTNKPGDGDFDFMMRVDKSIYSNPKKMDELRKVLLKHLGREQEYDGIISSGDFRLKGVDVTSDVKVDIDITFIEKTDKVSYSTDMALEDRLKNIKKQDPEKFNYVVANILLAKKVLKEASAYKPNRGDTPQGGMGGVGIENWVLQHGGSFYDAATSFLEAAEGKSFEEFKNCYFVWDFGENHLADKKGKYPHDNFVANNMSSDGYSKMVAALKKYVDSKRVEENKTNSK